MLFREKNNEKNIFEEPNLEKNADKNDPVTRMIRKLEQEECKNDPVIQVIREKFARVREKFELANKKGNDWAKREELSLCNDIAERLEKSLNERFEKLTKKK